MATSCLNEMEDLITCPICLNEYDEKDEAKKPKLLSCSHSVCFGCLKVKLWFFFISTDSNR